MLSMPCVPGLEPTPRSDSPRSSSPGGQNLAPQPPRITNLFGTDGIRGQTGEFLTHTLAMQVGYQAGRVLREHYDATSQPLILGQDSRSSSDMLAMALTAGLTAAGIDVWHLGLCPTPCVAYLTHSTPALGGVMISASHNPPADNGIKFFSADGSKLSLDLQQEIEARLQQDPGQAEVSASPTGNRWGSFSYRPELLAGYQQFLRQPLAAVNLQGLRVVLDLAWGAAVHLAPAMFQELGAEVICLHNQPDGSRINVNCGSTHLEPLKAAVTLHNADLGFAFDGDADRVLAVDAQGRVIDGDYILYLWGQQLQQQQQLPGNLIVATVMSNLGFERAWQRQGGQLVRSAVGDQYVHAEMLNHGAKLGGEQSGHILCPHYGVGGDGLLTALHLAAITQQTGVSLAELRDQSFQTYPQILRNVRVSDRLRRLGWHNCDPLQQAISAAEADLGDEGRILVRASGTEPVVRVMVESHQAERAEHWSGYLAAVVEQHLGS